MNNILIKFEQISEPIKDIYKNINYRDILTLNKINETINKKKLIHIFDQDIDNCMLYAIQAYDNLNNFIIFVLNKKESHNYYLEHFKDDYSLYGIKYLRLDFKSIHKILYQLLFPRFIIKNIYDLMSYIETNYPYISKYDKEFIDVSILIVCKKDLKKKYPSEDIKTNDYVIYIPNTKETIWNSTSIFFSETTLKFLEIQNFEFFFSKEMESSKKMFLKYRNWLNDNIDYRNQHQFMLNSSIVLYLLGNRNMNDLDLYIHTIPNDIIEKTEELKTEEYKFIDFKIKNTSSWPHYWNTWLDIWAQKCGAKYFEEILGNPKYHFYFLGIKIISLECDITRRITRQRPRAIADLISLRKRYHLDISIPKIPEKINKYICIDTITIEEKNKYLEEGGVLNENNNEIVKTENNDINKSIQTIIYALNTRYKMTFTETDIRRELNMEIGPPKVTKKTIKISYKKK